MTCNEEKTKIKKYFSRILVLFLSLTLIVFGLFLYIIWPYWFDSILQTQLNLTPNSKTFQMWEKNPFPLYLDFYFFNWTNADQVLDPNVKPHFQEVGPFRFREEKNKVNIIWNENQTVTYNQQRFWHFVPEASNGSLKDVITTVNVVAVTAAIQTRYAGFFMQNALSLALSRMGLADIFVKKTVGELLFEGYEDSLIDIGKTFENFQSYEIPPYDKFGWFYMRNGTVDFDGTFNMGTVEDHFGILENYNFKNQTKFFPDQCGMVNGSAGELWPVNPQPTNISMFSNDLCRSLTFDFEKQVSILDIDGYKYIGGDAIMDNGTLYPENKCFCNGECVPSGALNASSCRFGAPAFVSFPHFYHADPYYRQIIDGMKPDKDLHSFHITLEKKTGIPLDVAARFQINILLQPLEHITLFANVPKIFIPMLWFEQKATINEQLGGDLKLLLTISSIGYYVSIGIICLGILMGVILTIRMYITYNTNQKCNEVINRWGFNGEHRQMKKSYEIKDVPCEKTTNVYVESC